MLARRFEAAIFDWDGTAVPDRDADASRVRALVEALCASGLRRRHRQRHARRQRRRAARGPPDRARGAATSASIAVPRSTRSDRTGPSSFIGASATADEDEALTAAAEATVGGSPSTVSGARSSRDRLNRRKIDLIPEPEWADPPKARIGELLAAVESVCSRAGSPDSTDVAALADAAARDAGLGDPRVTSDVKHVEIGLTDKSDSARWLFAELARRGVGPHAVLVGGDEFGAIGGLPGSDSLMLVEAAPRDEGVGRRRARSGCLRVSSGSPAGRTPSPICSRTRCDGGERGELPLVDRDPGWTFAIEGFDPALERAREALLTLADGCIGTSGSALLDHVGHASARSRRRRLRRARVPRAACSRARSGRDLGRTRSDADLRRVLDLRSGVLVEELSLATVHSCAHCGCPRSLAPGRSVCARRDRASLLRDARRRSCHRWAAPASAVGTRGRAGWMQVHAAHGGVAAALGTRRVERGERSARAPRLPTSSEQTTTPEPRTSARGALGGRGGRASTGSCPSIAPHGASAGTSRRHRDRGRPRAPAGRSPRALSADGVGRPATGRPRSARADSPGPATAATCSGTPTSSCCPFLAATGPQAARAVLEYRVRRLPAARQSGARARDARARASRGSRPAAAATSRPTARAPARRDASRSSRASSRSTSSPTSRGRPPATSTGPATRSSGAARASRSSSRRRATGPRASGSTRTDVGTSTASSAPTSTTRTSTTTRSRTSWRAGTSAERRRPSCRGRRQSRRGRAARAGSRSPTPSSTATTRRPACTSSSPASSGSSRSSSRRLRRAGRRTPSCCSAGRVCAAPRS